MQSNHDKVSGQNLCAGWKQLSERACDSVTGYDFITMGNVRKHCPQLYEFTIIWFMQRLYFFNNWFAS